MKNTIKLRFIIASLLLLSAVPLQAQKKKRTEDVKPVYKQESFGKYMKDWFLAGPFPVKDGTGEPSLDEQKTFFEQDPALTASFGTNGAPATSFQFNGKTYQWKKHHSADDVLDLDIAYPKTDYAAIYAYAEIQVEQEQSVLLGLGSDDGVKVWLNDKLVHDNWIPRGVTRDQDIVPLTLVKGSNKLLLKVQDMQQGWGFIVRVMDKAALGEKLVTASRNGLVDDVNLLLGSGADINSSTENGLTPYSAAKLAGRDEVTTLLSSKGANTGAAISATQLVDNTYKKFTVEPSPATVVLVAQNGKITYEKAFGLADVNKKTPATIATKFRIGSITKQFTASAILKLQEEGKISIHDKLSKFFPDFPRGDEVTIHHLLTHTSGIHSYTGKTDFIEKVVKPVSNEELLAYFKNDPYDFNPGYQYRYNNSGYFLLGYIIEKISGKSYAEYLDATFFQPLGMINTGVYSSKLSLREEAIGHSYENGKYSSSINWDMTWAGGAGAIYSTVEDLYKWNEAVFNGKVLSEANLKAAHTSVVLNNGNTPDDGKYGYGWGIGEFRNTPVISHSGGLHGFVSQLARYPEHNLTVVLLTNVTPPVSEMNPSTIAEFFIWDKLGKQSSFAVGGPVKDTKPYEGRYDFKNGAVMIITSKDGNLFAQLSGQQNFPIFPSGPDDFFWKVVPAKIKFLRDDNGVVTGGAFEQNGMKLQVPKLKEDVIVSVDPAIYKKLEGKYKFQGTEFKISSRDNRLFVQTNNQPEFELFPVSENDYVVREVNAKLSFVKEQEKVISIAIDMGGQKIDAPRIE